MKSVQDLLRQKETDFQRLQREVEALRIAAQLLEAEGAAPAASAPREGTYSAAHANAVAPPVYPPVKAAAGPPPAADPQPPRMMDSMQAAAVADPAVPKNYWP